MAHGWILIIEDEPDLRETLRDLLEMEGFEVATAANGREGLAVLEEAGKPCLILLDLMMPVMDGWQFLEALRNRHQPAGAAVVIVSAVADVSDVGERYGCEVLKKPVKIAQLLAFAHAHCKGGPRI
jgi:DNA-binding response OmpR family regulator